MALIALHPGEGLLFDRCFHSLPAPYQLSFLLTCCLHPCYRAGSNFGHCYKNFLNSRLLRGSTLGRQLKRIHSTQLFSPFCILFLEVLPLLSALCVQSSFQTHVKRQGCQVTLESPALPVQVRAGAVFWTQALLCWAGQSGEDFSWSFLSPLAADWGQREERSSKRFKQSFLLAHLCLQWKRGRKRSQVGPATELGSGAG